MRLLRIHPWLLALGAILLAMQPLAATAREALLVDLDGAIGPACVAYLDDALGMATPVQIGDLTSGPLVLNPADATILKPPPNWPDGFLRVLSDPNIAYILLLIGFYGLIFELAYPGHVLPGTLGALCLLVALYAFQWLPVSWAGLALIGLGLGLMIAEAFVPSFGALGLGGITAFVIGSLILIDTDTPGYAISVPLIASFAVTSAALLILVVGVAVRAHRRPVTTGGEQLIGAHGTAVAGFPGPGSVHLNGEVWSAHSTQFIPPGTAVRVIGRDGLTLKVEPQPHE
jgi:membrane-bound serine protease (ClpP class)